ncbi:hypothetical protein, partial [Aminobacter sp. MET-1]|uniref:hypothetical protein n=1 Tax=Aminobacter sp. MET-1 TaxID=2951085 RepID=UPI002269FAC0
VEAYIVATPSNCQRPNSNFCEFFATTTQTPTKPCVRQTKIPKTSQAKPKAARNPNAKSMA